MVTIGMNYQVLGGKEEVFERAFKQVSDAMQQFEGHLHSQLFKAVGNVSTYLIMSEWASNEAFNKFIRSDAFARVTQWGKEQILAGPPKHRMYETKA